LRTVAHRREPTASTVGLVSSFVSSLRRRWFRDALQRYGFTAVQRESLSGAAQDGRPVACTVLLVPSSWLLGLRSLLESASFLSEDPLIRRSPDRDSPWHRAGIGRCIDPATALVLPPCSDSRQGESHRTKRERATIRMKSSSKRLWE